MKKKVTALLLAMVCSLSLVACGSDAEMSAAVRGPETDNGMVYIDDAAVALAGSMQTADMTEEEKARAEELRAMAVAALDLVNAERAAVGLPALVWDEDLEACAQVRATEIVTTFSHTRPNGTDWWTVNSDLMWGENLAKGYKNAESLVNAWMNSPTHAANILEGSYVTCSIAVYETNGKLYFAQEFGY
ncbi:MAG: CAP domain-containing protein [Lachnospiraceae bacterium]|nr:CAP domain-containing protein [Lachnospiraceae bacterium]